ncbi:hypothetical protein FSOLCH5_014010 [Fusarium solani]
MFRYVKGSTGMALVPFAFVTTAPIAKMENSMLTQRKFADSGEFQNRSYCLLNWYSGFVRIQNPLHAVDAFGQLAVRDIPSGSRLFSQGVKNKRHMPQFLPELIFSGR